MTSDSELRNTVGHPGTDEVTEQDVLRLNFDE